MSNKTQLKEDLIVATRIKDQLNKMSELDKDAFDQILNVRIKINEQIVNHPTIQCREEDGKACLSLLGFFNGLLTDHFIVGYVGEDDKIENFGVIEKTKIQWAE